jgi:hypothetical protein
MHTHALPLASPLGRRPAGSAPPAPAGSRPDSDRPAARRPDARRPAAGAVPVSPEPARAGISPVLRRRAGLVALAVGGFLLPWCVVLGATLPATAQAQHWPAAWVGLDAGEAIAALATAVLLARADARAALTAAAGGALLLTDAWFDVCTSGPGAGRALALAEAAVVELPLAGAAFWLAARLTRSGRSARDAR